MLIKNAIASLAVSDLNKSRVWYEKIFERPPDSEPMPEVVEWKFERGGWLQIYQLTERAGNGSVTLATDNIDEMANLLNKLGVYVGKQISGETVKTIMIRDPDGNSIAFANVSDPTMAH